MNILTTIFSRFNIQWICNWKKEIWIFFFYILWKGILLCSYIRYGLRMLRVIPRGVLKSSFVVVVFCWRQNDKLLFLLEKWVHLFHSRRQNNNEKFKWNEKNWWTGCCCSSFFAGGLTTTIRLHLFLSHHTKLDYEIASFQQQFRPAREFLILFFVSRFAGINRNSNIEQ